jgi:hypothetical protein
MLAAMDLLLAPAMYANVVQLMNGVEPADDCLADVECLHFELKPQVSMHPQNSFFSLCLGAELNGQTIFSSAMRPHLGERDPV